MRDILNRIILLFLMMSFTLPCEACRFTVREIGFSVLSETPYSIVIVDGTTHFDDPIVRELRKMAKQSNIKVQLLDPDLDVASPLLIKAREKNIHFPNMLFCTPGDSIYPLFESGEYSLKAARKVFKDIVLQSPLRKQLLENISETFAYVISISGKDEVLNKKVKEQIQDACNRLVDVMPLMPKTVDNPPAVLGVTADNQGAEKILLLSLGFREIPKEPHVVVVYGRGRFMGKPLSVKEINQNMIYRYLAMIGADCECNLDRTWMLGTQLPLMWTDETRQQLATKLTFDVDNPMILAEMSRILSKEELTGETTASFTPETIDLDEVFDTPEQDDPIDESEDSFMPGALMGTLAVLLLIAVLVSFFIIRKSR